MSTDQDWQILGRRDPYFSVLTEDRYRNARLTPEALEAFFRTGAEEAAGLLADSRKHLGEVSTNRTLEFGCGVGRLLIPFAGWSQQCVGVDVSDAMREEAARNCNRFQRSNVRLLRSLDELGGAETFTFVYSYIVLQHIEAERGLEVIAELLGRLEEGGCAAIHVTFAHVKYSRTLGVEPWRRGLTRRARQPFSSLLRRIRGLEPKMQMNAYPLNELLFRAHEHGIRGGGFRLTDHYGHLGLILFLKRD